MNELATFNNFLHVCDVPQKDRSKINFFIDPSIVCAFISEFVSACLCISASGCLCMSVSVCFDDAKPWATQLFDCQHSFVCHLNELIMDANHWEDWGAWSNMMNAMLNFFGKMNQCSCHTCEKKCIIQACTPHFLQQCKPTMSGCTFVSWNSSPTFLVPDQAKNSCSLSQGDGTWKLWSCSSVICCQWWWQQKPMTTCFSLCLFCPAMTVLKPTVFFRLILCRICLPSTSHLLCHSFWAVNCGFLSVMPLDNCMHSLAAVLWSQAHWWLKSHTPFLPEEELSLSWDLGCPCAPKASEVRTVLSFLWSIWPAQPWCCWSINGMWPMLLDDTQVQVLPGSGILLNFRCCSRDVNCMMKTELKWTQLNNWHCMWRQLRDRPLQQEKTCKKAESGLLTAKLNFVELTVSNWLMTFPHVRKSLRCLFHVTKRLISSHEILRFLKTSHAVFQCLATSVNVQIILRHQMQNEKCLNQAIFTALPFELIGLKFVQLSQLFSTSQVVCKSLMMWQNIFWCRMTSEHVAQSSIVQIFSQCLIMSPSLVNCTWEWIHRESKIGFFCEWPWSSHSWETAPFKDRECHATRATRGIKGLPLATALPIPLWEFLGMLVASGNNSQSDFGSGQNLKNLNPARCDCRIRPLGFDMWTLAHVKQLPPTSQVGSIQILLTKGTQKVTENGVVACVHACHIREGAPGTVLIKKKVPVRQCSHNKRCQWDSA